MRIRLLSLLAFQKQKVFPVRSVSLEIFDSVFFLVSQLHRSTVLRCLHLFYRKLHPSIESDVTIFLGTSSCHELTFVRHALLLTGEL